MRGILHRTAAAVLTAALAVGGVVAIGVAPASAASVDLSGFVDESGPRASAQCGFAGVHAAYDEVPFTVTVEGVYEVRPVSSTRPVTFSIRVPDGGCDASYGEEGIATASLSPGQLYLLHVESPASTSYVVNVTGPGDIVTSGPAPTISQADGQADPSRDGSVRFVVDFAEPVVGFDASDASFSGTAGATSAIVSGGPSSYTVEAGGMTSSGTVTLGVAAGAATSTASGFASLASTATDATVTYAPAPTVTISQVAGQTDWTSTVPISFDVVFSEPVTGFDAADINELSRDISHFVPPTVTGSGTTYVVSLHGGARHRDAGFRIYADAAQTAFGTGNQAEFSPPVYFAPVPAAVVLTPLAGQPDPVAALPVSFAIEVAYPVTDLTASDVVVGGTAGATTATLTGSGSSYVATVSDATRAGTITARVPAGVATSYGMRSTASETATVSFAPANPTARIEQAAGQSDPTTTDAAAFDVTFSEAVTGLDAQDFEIGGTSGASDVVLSGSGDAYVATVSGSTQPGTITLALGDGAAVSAFDMPSLAATSVDASVDFRPDAPTVTVALAPGQTSPTSSETLRFLVAFSQPVSVIDGDALVVDTATGAAVWAARSIDGGLTHVVELSNVTRGGPVSLSFAAGGITNEYGVANAASNSATIVFEPVRPTITIEQAAGQVDPTASDAFDFDVTFSTPVSGLDSEDFVVGGSAGATQVALQGSGAQYVATVSGATAPGTVTLALPDGAALGAFQAPSQPSTSVDAQVTFAPPAPTVTVEQSSTQADPETFGFIVFEVQLSREVTGLEASDFIVGGTAGATTVALEGSGSYYRASVFDMVRHGTVTLALPAGAAVDRYGIANLASTSVDATVQFAPPIPTGTIARADGQPASTNVLPLVFDVSFSVPVSGFDAADVIVLGNGRDVVVEVAPRAVPQFGGEDATSAAAIDAVAADDVLYDWTVRVSGTFDAGSISIAVREGGVVSGFGVPNARIDAAADAAVAYAPVSAVTPAPVATAPVAGAPVQSASASTPSTLPRTGGEPSWALVLAAALLLALGAVARRTRTR